MKELNDADPSAQRSSSGVPADYVEDVLFSDLFSLAEIQQLQDDFSDAMNVASIITCPDGVPLTRPSNFTTFCSDIIRSTEIGRCNCYKSDGAIGSPCFSGPIIQQCLSGGLWDAGASITVGGKHVANWLIGQVRDEAQDEEQMLRYADEIGADREAFLHALAEVPVMTHEHFSKIARLLFSFAKEISTRAYQNVQQTRFIAERSQAEKLMRMRLRLLELPSTHTLEEVLVATLDEAEALTGSQIGFYHFLEEDQKTLSLQAWSTRTTREMCQAVGAGRHYDVAEAGIWVDCIRQRHPVIHNDYAAVSHRKGLPPGHAPVIRELVVPVFRGEKIVAILGVGNKPIYYTDEDVHAVSQMADLAWDIAALKQAQIEQQRLIQQLQKALAQVNTLSGLLPICAGCKKIRDDQGFWFQIESYISQHSDAQFSHGLCPDCAETYFPEYKGQLDKLP